MNNVSLFFYRLCLLRRRRRRARQCRLEQSACGSAPASSSHWWRRGGEGFLAEDGYAARQGQLVAKTGLSHTPQGKWLDGQTA